MISVRAAQALLLKRAWLFLALVAVGCAPSKKAEPTCSFDGISVANGASVKAFEAAEVEYGETCKWESRSCGGTTLTGGFAYASCKEKPAANCAFQGQALVSGASVTAFQSSSVPFGQTCASQSRSCTNGTLSGSYTHTSCTVSAPASCTFQGQTVNSGANVTAFQSSSVPFGQTCASQSRTCTNGTLSGSFTHASCTVSTAANCNFNGQTVNSGSDITAFQSSSVPFGQTCASQARTCTNGTLSGSYTHSACTVAAPANCTFNGQTVNSGSSVTAYQSSSVAAGQTCSAQQRTCSNGSLSGSFGFSSCVVNTGSATSVTSITPSGDAYVDAVIAGIKWGMSSLTYGAPAAATGYNENGNNNYGSGETTKNFQALNATQQAATRAVATANMNVHNLAMVEVSGSAADTAVLRYAESDLPSTAWAYYPSTSSMGGDSWYNGSKNWYDNPVKGNYGWTTFNHETGHALGLKHPHSDFGVFKAMPSDGDAVENSVMSYHSYIGSGTGGYTNGGYSYPQTLMKYDIAALQLAYGANYTVNATNSVYQWNAQTGEMVINGVGQGAPGANKIFLTVWDGGGTDTYDFSNYASDLKVDLEPGSWSTTSSTQLADLGSGRLPPGNIANALLFNNNSASLIENAVGGSGNDILKGNVANNRLSGGPGNDTLDGKAGFNTAVFTGASTQYSITPNPDGTMTVADLRSGSPDGTDTLTLINALEFSNGIYAITSGSSVNHAPGAATDAYAVDQGASIYVAAAAGVLANDSDSEQERMHTELAQAPAHGSLQLNADGSFTYTPHAGFSGADQFRYRASDGIRASAPASVTIQVQAPGGSAIAQAAPGVRGPAGVKRGKFHRMGYWARCGEIAKRGLVFELQNEEGKMVQVPCSSKLRMPFDWKSAPVRFRMVEESAPERSAPPPPPLQ